MKIVKNTILLQNAPKCFKMRVVQLIVVTTFFSVKKFHFISFYFSKFSNNYLLYEIIITYFLENQILNFSRKMLVMPAEKTNLIYSFNILWGDIIMELRQLRYFLQVYKHQSFSKASAACFISQQGLSQSISALEEELGVTLFNRTHKGLKLTKHGEFLHARCVPIIEAIDDMTEKIIASAKPDFENVRIGFSFGVINALLINNNFPINQDYIDKFSFFTEYPDYLCQEKVLNGELDIAFTLGPIDDNLFDSYFIQSNKMIAVVNEKNPVSKKSMFTLEDFKKEQIIAVNETFKTYTNIKAMCQSHGFSPKFKHVVSDITTLFQMAKSNLGIGITVDFNAEQFSCSELKILPIPSDLLSWDVYMIMKKNNIYNNDVYNFWKHVKSSYENKKKQKQFKEQESIASEG